MWLAKNVTCLVKGHDCSELTFKGEDFTYCHRCGQVKESRFFKAHTIHPVNVVTHRASVATMPVDKIWR